MTLDEGLLVAVITVCVFFFMLMHFMSKLDKNNYTQEKEHHTLKNYFL